MKLKVSNVCQLLPISDKEDGISDGVTFTNNHNGTWTASGVSTGSYGYSYYNIFNIKLIEGHTYLVPAVTYENNTYVEYKWLENDSPLYNINIYTAKDKSAIDIGLLRLEKSTADPTTFNLQLFDLTEMYGAGHEPTTVEQFRQDFPNEMYDYSPECWKRLKELRYRTETKNLLDYSKFNPVWKNDGVIKSSGYISKSITSFNSSLFYPVVGFSENLPDVSNLLALQGTYTFSISSVSIGDIYIMKYNADGTMNKQLGVLANTKKTETLTFDELTYVDIKIQKETAVVITGLMVQEGSTATSYQPYGYLPLRRGKFIVNKEPVQLFNKATYPVTQTNKGVTFTNNGDGTITVNGTATDSGNAFSLQVVTLHKDHLYFVYADQSGSFANIVFTVDALGSVSNVEGNFWKSSVEGEKQAYFWVTSGTTINNRVYKPQLFDLTAMYGAGSEPTTVEQFRTDYPNDLYEYNLLNAVSFH